MRGKKNCRDLKPKIRRSARDVCAFNAWVPWRTLSKWALLTIFITIAFSLFSFSDQEDVMEKTCFQVAHSYDRSIDLKADVAIVYGINSSLNERVNGWRQNGYIAHLMTGIAWGGYQDYLYGRFDGEEHLDDAQMDRNGDRVSHGGDVYYMVPTESFTEYIKSLLKQGLDSGVEAIHMEEPEFWVRSGYSESFKREWKDFYETDWVGPASSEDASYKASKLKQFLYFRAIKELASFVRNYSKTNGNEVRFYIPTHSLINYAQWHIVSPESLLLEIPELNGLIAQVWTGTARTPNLFNGVSKERTFETALMEYGYFANLVKNTGRKVWFLHDPVEDNPDHTWRDYSKNYEKTVVASLLYPEVSSYEVMPWPWRVFHGEHPLRKENDEWGKGTIPSEYATEVLTVISTLNDMEQEKLEWDLALDDVGMLVSDTMMFQKPDMSSFYGIVLPLLKAGIFVQPVPLENLSDDYKVLFLSYEFMKPPSEKVHERLVKWVTEGGTLIYVDDMQDPYNSISEWWKEKGYEAPALHLFDLLDETEQRLQINETGEGTYKIGKGCFVFSKQSPKELAREKNGANFVLDLLKEIKEYEEQNYLMLRCGPYVIAAVMDESVSEDSLHIEGNYIDIFDPALPVIERKLVNPDEVALLYDLSEIDRSEPKVLTSASRIHDERIQKNIFSFSSFGPENVTAKTRVFLPSKPKDIKIETLDGKAWDFQKLWNEDSNTLLLTYENFPEGLRFEVKIKIDS